MNEGRVYFALDGDDFDPDELTLFLGIEPSYILRKGSRIPGRVPVKNSWSISTENIVNEYINIFEMSSSIIKIIKPFKGKILEAVDAFKLTPRFEVVLSISMSDEYSTPALGFEADDISFLGEIGAFIDIDTYRNES